MRKRIYQMAIAMCMIATMNTSVAFAAAPQSKGPGYKTEITGTAETKEVEQPTVYTMRRSPEQLSAKEIMTELYANESVAAVKDAAITEAMLLTGEKEITSDKYGIYVGRYDIPVWPSAMYPLGDAPDLTALVYAYADHTEYAAYATAMGVPNADKMKEYKQQLNLFYNSAWDIKSATASMNDEGKARYIGNWIASHVKADESAPYSYMTCLAAGRAACAGKSGMFQVMATFCGLEAKQVEGLKNNSAHTWNFVKVNGSWLYVDVSWGDYFKTEDEMTALNYRKVGISGEKYNMLNDGKTKRLSK